MLKKTALIALVAVIVLVAALPFLPASWFHRQRTAADASGVGISTIKEMPSAGVPVVSVTTPTSVTGTIASLNGDLADDGDDPCTITVYWGATNGGSDPGSWDNSGSPTYPAQPQGAGSFYESVTGLTTATTYWFTAKAANSYGETWATPLSFKTGNIFYCDYENGNDATTAIPLGWWSAGYTSGSGAQPEQDQTATGGSTGSTVKVTVCTVSSGTWAGGDAAGTLYWYGKSAAFAAETLTFSTTSATCSIAADFTYCAWKTFNNGATAARTAPGDTIRVAKSQGFANVGCNATWTNLSRVVTLSVAQNANINMCETAWTKNATGDTTVSRMLAGTYGKEGTYSMAFGLDSSPQASKMQAYYDIDCTDLSGYQKISFWLGNSAVISASQWYIALCSDNLGAIAVDTFAIPAIPSVVTDFSTYPFVCLTLEKDGGGNLGSSIDSIAIYTGTSAPVASSYLYVDDFVACTTNGLNLQSLISKCDVEQGSLENPESWYAIKSINGATLNIDSGTSSKMGNGRGYSTTGTSPETVPLYKRETTHTPLQDYNLTVPELVFQESGTTSAYIDYEGGFDPVTNQQTGETIWDGLSGFGGGFRSAVNYITLNYFGCVRYYWGFYPTGDFWTSDMLTTFTANTYIGFLGYSRNVDYGTVLNVVNNSEYGMDLERTGNMHLGTIVNMAGNTTGLYVYSGSQVVVDNITNCINNYRGVWFMGCTGERISNLNSDYNTQTGVLCQNGGINYIWNYVSGANDGVPVLFGYVAGNDQLYLHNYGTPGTDVMYTNGGSVTPQDVTTYYSDGMAWQYGITETYRGTYYPVNMPIARVYCPGGVTTTVTVAVKKDDADGLGASLFVAKNQLAGITDDIQSYKVDDTNWQEVSIDITPTQSGIVEIEGRAWCVTSTGSVYFDTTFGVTTLGVSYTGTTLALIQGTIGRIAEYSRFYPEVTPELNERGVVYDIDSGAPYSNVVSETGTFTDGNFSEGVSGLSPGTLYYYNTYGTSYWGTVYGSEGTFLTKPDEPSGFMAANVSDTENDLAWTKGNGADNTIIRGKQGNYPTSITDGVEVYNDTGNSCAHSGLSTGEHWCYRAWSYTTDGGLSQYSDLSVMDSATTGLTLSVPVVSTLAPAVEEETSALVAGTVTDDGNANVTTRGVEYDTDSGVPYAFDWHEDGDFGEGAYTGWATGLSEGTLYYCRAYAENSEGTGYGSEETFLTKPDAPIDLTATPTTAILYSLAWTKGDGAQTTVIRGKVGSYPTDAADGTLIYDGVGVMCTHDVAGEHWYYRAWSFVSTGGHSHYSDTTSMDTCSPGGGLPAVPDAPTDLIATMSTDNMGVTLEWTIGAGADYTQIQASLSGYPTAPDEGETVYFGGADTCIDDLGWEMATGGTTVYYSAWSINGGGYSPNYATASTAGGNAMTNALILIPMILLLGGLTIFGERIRNWPLILIAGFGWFLFAGWCMVTSIQTWDAFFVFAILGVMVALVTFIWPLVTRPNQLPKDADDMSEEDKAWAGRRPRKPNGWR
jgi:hypothetical protein